MGANSDFDNPIGDRVEVVSAVNRDNERVLRYLWIVP